MSPRPTSTATALHISDEGWRVLVGEVAYPLRALQAFQPLQRANRGYRYERRQGRLPALQTLALRLPAVSRQNSNRLPHARRTRNPSTTWTFQPRDSNAP